MGSSRSGVLQIAVLLCVSLLPRMAAAQVSTGPMTVKRIGNSAFIAPDFKITDFNGKTSAVAGAFGGYLVENTFFVGAGGYGLTDPSNQRDMWYFGLVTGVYINRDRPVSYGFKALIGGGEATFAQQYGAYPPPPQPRSRTGPPVYVAAYQTDIFVFEPEANIVVQMNKHMALSGGVGYRFTGDPYWGHYYGYGYNGRGTSELNGVTGTVSVHIGSGF